MNHAYEEPKKRSMLIISLLLHLVVLLLLFLATDQGKKLLPINFTKKEEAPEYQQQFDQNRLAALKPRGSVFGAPVIFQEEPEFTPNIYDPHSEQTKPQKEENEPNISKVNQEIPEQQEPAHAAPTISSQQENQEPEIVESKQEINQKQPDVASTNIQTEASKEQPPQINKPEKPQVTPEVSDKPTTNHPVTKKIIQKKQPRFATRHNPGDQQKNAAPMTKKVTFADLMNGFLDSMNKGGTDWLEREGDESIRPDFQEMKYLSYINKIAWYMQNEWKKRDLNIQIPPSKHVTLKVVLYIAKNGTLNNLRVIQSSGYEKLDAFLIKGMQNASPYPPVPGHLGDDELQLGFSVRHIQEESPLRMSVLNSYR